MAVSNEILLNEIKKLANGGTTRCQNHEDSIQKNAIDINTNGNDIRHLTNLVGNLSRTTNKVIWFVATTFIGTAIVIIFYKIFGVK